jgi:dTDP-4-dehydrorhamnose 3,5-epimerase
MFERLAIQDVFLYTPKRFGDSRGFFMESFNLAALMPMTGPQQWVQDNHSRSEAAGTVRGLHLQLPPFAQDKLVRCVRGAILDVAVDIRHGSPTYGQHVSAELSDENGVQIYVPRGFAHGFITLTPGAEVQYKVTNYYNVIAERSIHWLDPDLNIQWGAFAERATLSDKDQAAPLLKKSPIYFTYPC